jgi:hypothetical protein
MSMQSLQQCTVQHRCYPRRQGKEPIYISNSVLNSDLESKLHALDRLHGALSTLCSVIPRCKVPIDAIDFPIEYKDNKFYPVWLQPFHDASNVSEVYSIGSLPIFGCLAPLLLADAIQHTDDLDFKAYSCNFMDEDNNSVILSLGIKDHNTDKIEELVRLWMEKCNLPNCRKDVPVRRCIVVCFRSLFNHHGSTVTSRGLESRPNYLGHAITLALELDKRVLTLRIYDSVMHEYIYSVHDQFFQWMLRALEQHHTLYDSVHTETVCLKNRVRHDGLFMTCMSVAYRVCLYLSMKGDVKESEADFNEDNANFKGHIIRMIKWAQDNDQVRNRQRTVLISSAMNKSVFEINRENCYFLFAPCSDADRVIYSVNDSDSGILKAVEKRIGKKLRYSIKDGFQEL